MIRVLVADDEAPARAKLSRLLEEHDDVVLISAAANGLEAAERIARDEPDLVFLDIRMSGLTGLEVAAQLDATGTPLMVFVTAYDEFAVRAFELDAVDYLLKPYDKDRLSNTLTRVRSRLAGRSAGQAEMRTAIQVARTLQQVRGPLKRLLVPTGECLHVIDATSILWLEADDNYVHLHVGARRYTLRRTLQALLEQLDRQSFVRIHKSSAVNIAAISSLEPLFKGDYELKLCDGRTLRLSRRFSNEVMTLLGRK